MVVHPSNHFLYAANQNTNTISLFKINSTTGALDEVLPRTALVTSSGGVGLSPAVMTMDSGGKYLFVGNQITNDIWVYSIGSSGALTFVSSAPVGASPARLTLSASDGFLYVPVPTFSAVYVFSVSAGSIDAGWIAIHREWRSWTFGNRSRRKIFICSESVSEYGNGVADSIRRQPGPGTGLVRNRNLASGSRD